MIHFKRSSFLRCLLLIFIIVTLSSCLEVKQTININKDGSGDATLEVAVQQEWASQLIPKLKSDSPKGWNIIEEKKREGKHIIVFGRKFKDVSELNDDEARYTFFSERKGFLKKSYVLEIKQLKSSDMPFPYEVTIKMPGSIDETSGNKISSNEAKWNLQGLRRGTKLTVKSSALALLDFASLKEAFNTSFNKVFYREAIVFLRDGNLWVMDSDGKNQRQLTRGGVREFSVSKNGKIVFSNPKTLVSRTDEGAEIFKVEDLDLYILDISTGSLQKLTNDNRSRSGVISPDGTKIVFEKADWNDPDYGCCGKGTWLFNIKDKSEKELLKVVPIYNKPSWVNEAEWFADSKFLWSLDGKKLSFVRKFGKEVPLCTYLVEIDKPKSVIQIGKGLGDAIVPHDIHTEKLLFGVSKENYGMDLYIYSMRSGKFSLLQKDAGTGRFSPNGRRIAFTGAKFSVESYAYVIADLYVIDDNESDKAKIYSGEPWNLSWSSDGKKILFQQYNRNIKNEEIWIIGFNGSNLKKIADNASSPEWTSIPRITFVTPEIAKIIILAVIAVAGILFAFGMVLIARKAVKAAIPKLPKKESKQKGIFCSQCGKENAANANFCTGCGQKLK